MIYINLLIIILLIITIHEFGHYIAARIFKVDVTEFSIGFGKSIYQYLDKNKTKWKISILPLGGYVKISGLDSIFQKNPLILNRKGTFQSLSLIKKIIILLAGSFFNILSAFILLFIFNYFIGYKSYLNQIGEIQKNSPAYLSDIRKGDSIISIDNKIIKNFNDVMHIIGKKQNILIEIDRNNILIKKNVKLEFNQKYQRYFLGIASSESFTISKYDFNYSLYNSFYIIPNFYFQFFNSLKKSFVNNTITKELAGPIGIVKNADKLMLDNITGILNMFIVFSLSVSMLNLLPIPLLDGGHIIYFIIRSLFSDALPYIITKLYILIGLTIIFFIFFIVTFNDIFYK